jgi:predicted transposase/invertase (TIGR01784 family)
VFFEYLTDLEKRTKINEIINREAGIAMSVEELITISQDERERARMESELKYILDKQSLEVHFKRKLQAGLKASREEGLAEGLEKGMEKGREDEKRLIAKNFKAAGVPLDIIAQSTGLTLPEITTL